MGSVSKYSWKEKFEAEGEIVQTRILVFVSLASPYCEARGHDRTILLKS